jgi:hypothetical protein
MTPKSPTNATFEHNVNVLVRNGIISCNKELKALLVQLDSDGQDFGREMKKKYAHHNLR